MYHIAICDDRKEELDILHKNVKSFFENAHVPHTIDAFSPDIFRYIPKILLQSRLTPALTDALSRLSLQSEKYYLVQKNSSTYRLLYTQMLYIDRDGKKAVFHLNGGIAKKRASLDAVYARLEHHDFTFIEHGIIINLYHAVRLDQNVLTLSDGTLLTVSRSHLTNVRNTITKYVANH